VVCIRDYVSGICISSYAGVVLEFSPCSSTFQTQSFWEDGKLILIATCASRVSDVIKDPLGDLCLSDGCQITTILYSVASRK
jgi:hypothetical protein